MNLHLAEIAAEVAPGKHAVLVVDQAGWHLSAGLVVPDNITLVVLPPKCPELNPAENVWQFMRDNWLSDRVFASYTDVLRGLEQAHRAALDDHVHRPTRLGQWVLISGSWYNTGLRPWLTGLIMLAVGGVMVGVAMALGG